MPKQVMISPAVAAVLARAGTDGDKVTLPPEQLERSLYVAVDKVLRALGGKWDRRAQAHVFSGGIEGQLAEALAAGRAVDVKRTLEQFFTPPALAGRMVARADLKPGDKVLEPSAGDGALIRAALNAGIRPRDIWAYEIDERLRAALRTEFFSAFGAGGLGVDFLEAKPEPVFDAVLMNPPFSRNQDIRHVRHAFDMLKPGGRLVAIMSEHAAFAGDAASGEFRAWASSIGGEFDPLPDATFRESGTLVSSRIFCARKR